MFSSAGNWKLWFCLHVGLAHFRLWGNEKSHYSCNMSYFSFYTEGNNVVLHFGLTDSGAQDIFDTSRHSSQVYVLDAGFWKAKIQSHSSSAN